jgi:hypothetical protein
MAKKQSKPARGIITQDKAAKMTKKAGKASKVELPVARKGSKAKTSPGGGGGG